MGTFCLTKPCSTLAKLFIKEVEKIERGGIEAHFVFHAIEELRKQALDMNVFFAEIVARLTEANIKIQTAENQKKLEKIEASTGITKGCGNIDIDSFEERLKRLEEVAIFLYPEDKTTNSKRPQLLLVESNKNKAIDRFCHTVEAGMITTIN